MTTQTHPVPPALRARQVGVRLRLPVLVGAASAGVLGLLGTVSPYEQGHYPTCPFLAVTGLYCPGCGSLRALHDLAHLDVGSALARNPFTVLASVGLLVAFTLWVRRRWLGRPRVVVAPPWLLYLLLAAVVAFWVLRNIPGWTWLSPA